MRRRPLLALGAAALACAVTAVLSPATAAPSGPPAVAGALQQAYRATPFVSSTTTVGGGDTFFFTGTATDQVAKSSGAPTASFGEDEPTGSTDVVQLNQPVLTDGTSQDPFTSFWSGPFTGSTSGRMTLDWYWSTVNATASLIGNNVGVRVWADPGTPDEKLIGSSAVTISPAGATPVLQTSTVDVKGTVKETLLVQAVVLYADAGQDLRVYYGSATAPSKFTLPGADGILPAPPATIPVPDTDPLVVSATQIGRKAAEPTIGITKAGNAFIVAGDFDGISPANPRTLTYASYDGNKTYQDVTPLVAGQPFPPATLDPYIYVDQDTSRIFTNDLLVASSYLNYSDDEGKTWARGNPLATDGPVDDHQTIVTGPPPPGTTLLSDYPNVVYYCVNKVAGAVCSRNLDGGEGPFLAAGEPAFTGVQVPEGGDEEDIPAGFCGGLHGHIVTDADGRLFLPKGHCGRPWLAVSEDGGVTWTRTKVAAMPTAGTQTSVAVDDAGNVYYLWWSGESLLPYMAVSTDHGATFGPALLVGPPGLKAVNFPSIDAGRAGHVSITFPGTRAADATSNIRPWDYYVAVTENALEAQPVFHSSTSNAISDPVHRGVCLGRCAGMFDFLDVVIAPNGETWGAEVDTCTAACATAAGPAIVEGEEPSDAQGVVVRQLSGPGLGQVVAAPPAPAAPAAPGAAPTAPTGTATGGLAATGLTTTLPLAALLMLVAATALRRRGVMRSGDRRDTA